ncbi:related to transcription regulator (GntR-family) [Desulfotalea psychrophila LSv54]|uniref:Related to transcription regulator (GntR-family) n=2 Tax=Desulfotalea psychrophila TaxID=84980 RepID=Q6ANF2_DESPS|nr:related to transcription regulator (GntR-family) [Desulfotalea psychrophila LSv54]
MRGMVNKKKTVQKKISRVARDLVYNYLRKRMQEGEILPGNSLNLTELSEHLQISRTPLRDALIRLEAEGIVTIYPRSKVIVNKLEKEDFQYLYEVIGSLENTLCIRGMPHYTASILDEMEEVVKEMRKSIYAEDIQQYDILHRKSHDYFLTVAPNLFAERILVPVQNRLWDLPRRNFVQRWFLDGCDEHDLIIRALREKNETDLRYYVKERHWDFEYNKEHIFAIYFH